MRAVRERLIGVVLESSTWLVSTLTARRTPRTRFVILSGGRSGSTLLVELLDSHPEIRCEDELLHYPLFAPLVYVDRRSSMARKPVYGFKLLDYQLRQVQTRIPEPLGFVRQLVEAGYRVLYLERRNPLRMALSNILARQRGQYHVRSASALRPGTLTVPLEDVDRWLRAIEVQRETQAHLLQGVPYLHLVYETDLLPGDAQQATVDRVSRYLGVEPRAVRARLQRITPARIRDFVENHDALAGHLRGTPYERFLEE